MKTFVLRMEGIIMQKMSVTAKVKVCVSNKDAALLDKTMYAYRIACNWVAKYIFRTHNLEINSLNKILYLTLRSKYGLKSQMAQSVIKTVIAGSYKPITFR